MTLRRYALSAGISLALASSATPACAGVRALGPGGFAGPALLDGRVVWGSSRGVESSPVGGRSVDVIGRVPAAGGELVAGSGLVALRSGASLFTWRGDGFARVVPDAGEPPAFAIVPS